MHPSTFDEYQRSLPIPREGEVPPLGDVEIARITKVVFAPCDPGRADLFFLFGTQQCDWEGVAWMYRRGWFPKVLCAGKIGKEFFRSGRPISHHMRDSLVAAGVSVDDILIEEGSTNTQEDVANSVPIIEQAGIRPRSILFGAKAHHSGRCLLTLRRYFPEARLAAFTWPAWYDDVCVTAENWPQQEVSRARVWGEWQRIQTYSARGDIAMPD